MQENYIRICKSKEEGSEPRHLTKSEKEAALILLDTYYCDPVDNLKDFLENLTIIPDKVKGKIILTKEKLDLCEEAYNFLQLPDYLAYVKGEYIQTLIGGNIDDIITRINNGKSKKILHYTKEDLDKAKSTFEEYDDGYDDNVSDSQVYNTRSRQYLIEYEKARDRYYEILNFYNKFDEYQNDSAIETYKKNQKPTGDFADLHNR